MAYQDVQQILTGNGMPSPSLGNEGYFYLNNLTGDYYEKTDSDTWTFQLNIKGPLGSSGAKGDTGTAGSNGAKGDTGVGVKGDTGTAGGAGAKGDTGTAGSNGAKGDTGVSVKGDTGTAGNVGSKGDTGSAGGAGTKGDTGAAGSNGSKGDTGTASSVAGPKGDTGTKGDTGAGSSGPKGDTGTSGAKGDTGTAGGVTIISSGSLGVGATLPIINIPAGFAYIVLKITGASCDTTTKQPLVRVSTNNGSSYDSTAGNYVGQKVTGTTWAVYSTAALASLIDSATATNAQTFDATIVIQGYQGGPHARVNARVLSNTIEYQNFSTYIGSVSAINALQILWNGTGNFDAGTYTLYGYQ